MIWPLLTGVLAACAAADAPTAAVSEQAIVFGSDDRLDLFGESLPMRRALAASSIFALIKPSRLRFAPEGDVRIAAPPLHAMDAYCADTRFLQQPSAASCGATLIDSDLILTAAHCLRSVSSCRDFSFVLGYSEPEPAQLAPLSREEIFACRAVAVQERKGPGTREQLDYAIFQLDRPAPGPPARLRATADLAPGEAMSVIGFPEGLPVKLDAGARAVDVRATTRDSFTLTSDTFEGSSGAGVFDSALALTGVFSSGVADVERDNGCLATRVVPDSARPLESATYASRAVDALCKRGWPSERLCGISTRCGDGVCSVQVEDASRCPEDCASPRCGDQLCEQAEWFECPEDCGDRRPEGLPDAFYCDPERFGDGVCDCECGAPDSDCERSGCERTGPKARPVAVPQAAASCTLVGATEARSRSIRPGSALALVLLASLAPVRRLRRRRFP